MDLIIESSWSQNMFGLKGIFLLSFYDYHAIIIIDNNDIGLTFVDDTGKMIVPVQPSVVITTNPELPKDSQVAFHNMLSGKGHWRTSHFLRRNQQNNIAYNYKHFIFMSRISSICDSFLLLASGSFILFLYSQYEQ